MHVYFILWLYFTNKIASTNLRSEHSKDKFALTAFKDVKLISRICIFKYTALQRYTIMEYLAIA